MNIQVPIIGQNSEQAKFNDLVKNLSGIVPVHPFPFGHPNVPPYWIGKNLLDEFAQVAMTIVKQPNWGNATDEQVQKWAQHCWKVGFAMLSTRPGLKSEDTEAKTEPAAADA